MNIHEQSKYDFKVCSNNKESIISFLLEEYLQDKLPSLSCSIDIQDKEFKGCAFHVWFETSKLKTFILNFHD